MNSDLPVYQEFTYDTVDRLTGHTDYAGTAFTITYDANGNRNQYQPYDANAINYAIDPNSNGLLSASQTGGSTKTYGTDAAGNVLSNGNTSFSYDERGRLVEAIGPFGTETYRINGLGQRTAKATATGQTPEPGTYFAYDEAGHLLGEYSQTGTAIQETVWMGDTPVAILQGNSNYYIYPDQQNSPRAIADQTGKIIWRWTDPTFGTKQPNPDPDGDGTNFTYNQRYPGQYYDASTGLHYNWHRSYDPATGRYLESDPIGLEGGLNTYGYVGGDPVNEIDPTGQSSLTLGGAGGLAGGATVSGGLGNVLGVAGRFLGPLGTILYSSPVGVGSDVVPEACPPRPGNQDPCKGLRKQLQEHEAKLSQYLNDPLSMDNRGSLQYPLDKGNMALFWKIRANRIKELMGQIENFRRQLEECEKRYG